MNLKDIFPAITAINAEKYSDELETQMNTGGINTHLRKAAFLAQVGHESGQFRYVREIWGPTDAQKRYEGRKDLGNTVEGDGERYKGRGLIQTTGRRNYSVCSVALFGDDTLLRHPEMLEEPHWAVASAIWFWNSRGLNSLADIADQTVPKDGGVGYPNYERLTKKINGGLNGYAERLEFYKKALAVLS